MSPSERLRQGLELMELGFKLQSQNIRRRHPEWSEEQVRDALHRWMVDRPMDAPGIERKV